MKRDEVLDYMRRFKEMNFDVDAEEIFCICRTHVGMMQKTFIPAIG